MGLCESTNNKAPSTQTTTTSLTKPIYNTQSEGIKETNNTSSLTKPVNIIYSEENMTFNSGLQEDREKLAQEMVAYLKTHDTGNKMEDYNEFRDLFNERAQAIAEGGGNYKALKEIYYRIKFLCEEQGIDFHSGAVNNAFKGKYWRS